MMLKEKHEISNYEEKAKFLRENGWTDHWHVDNWVMIDWFNSPTINIDRAGQSTDSAYNLVKAQIKRRELIKSKIKQK